MRDITKLHWIKELDEGRYEMVLDHHMLSGWRSCQANFELLHIEGRRIKAGYSWPIEFGTLLHKMIEDIYKWRADGTFTLDRLTHEAYHMWDEKNMERFKDHKTCKSLGGKMGFIALCHAYAQYYTQDWERLRIIGTEIAFGRNREVPLDVVDMKGHQGRPIRLHCYLSGKIDFLADDGNKIGPVDHKTRAAFGIQDLGAGYNPHEGMSGYVYAAKHIIKTHYPKLAEQRQVNTAWMNFIQISHETNPLKRFKRVLLMRTDYQLEQFRLRQLETFKDIFRYLDEERPASWNTEMCAHWYGTDCVYRAVHRQPDEQSQLIVLNNDYTHNTYWNPEETEYGDNGNGAAGTNQQEPTKDVSGDSEVNAATMQE